MLTASSQQPLKTLLQAGRDSALGLSVPSTFCIILWRAS